MTEIDEKPQRSGALLGDHVEWIPLFLTDKEIGRRLFGRDKASCFTTVVPVLERTGFPRKDPTFGGRYWPAVKAWLDRRYGLTKADAGPLAPDGEEDWSWQRDPKQRRQSRKPPSSRGGD